MGILCRRVRHHCFGLLPPPHPQPCTTTPPPTYTRPRPAPTHISHHILPHMSNLGWSISEHQVDQIPCLCWSVHSASPCALTGACTWSLSLDNLFFHIPWPIIGQGSCGLARWAEIVFLCNRLAKITLITLTAVSRTP